MRAEKPEGRRSVSDRKSVLLTGGTGFIGRNLQELLGSRYNLAAPTRQELDLSDDAAVSSYLRAHPADVVIHAATTPGHRNARPMPDLAHANIRMFMNLARNADRFKKLIFLGSGAEYDQRYFKSAMPEEYFGEHVPVDKPGFAGYAISRYIERTPSMTDLRLFGVFGKYEDYEIRFISNAICKAIAGLPITLRRNRQFHYLWVEDLVPVLVHFIEKPAAHPSYNLVPDEPVDLLSLAELVRDISRNPVEIKVTEPGMGDPYTGSNARLRGVMPDLKFTPIREAVTRLHQWYGDHPDRIRSEALLVDK